MTGSEPITVLCAHLDSRPGPEPTTEEFSFERVKGTDEALSELEEGTHDCLLLGDPPQVGRQATLRRLSNAHPDVPVVLYGVSGDVGAQFDAGATDVVRQGAETAVLTARLRNVVERKRASARAQERHRQLKALLEYSSDWLSVLDEAGRYQFASAAVERGMGHKPEELLGDTAFEYVHPDDRDRVRETFEQICENPDQTHTTEYRLRDAEGDWRWLESRGKNRLGDPAIEGIIINSREITERKKREQTLAEERAFTDGIFEALPDIFYAFDEDINFLRWNDRLSEVTGYTDEEIAEMHPAEFVAQEGRQTIYEAISRVIEHDETVTVEAPFETKSGEMIPYEFTGAKMTQDGETLGLVGIGRDISDRKAKQRRFEAVFNNTYQFTGLMTPDGTLVEVNETALAFGGLERSDVVGSPLWEAYWFQNHEEARETAREAVEVARDGELFRAEVVVQGQDGDETIDFSVRPLTDEHGEVRMLIPEGRTITEIKQRERHLGILHRFLRHNLRNKMTVIQCGTDLLERELAGTDHLEQVEQIRAAANELTELSETANELSRVVTATDSEQRQVDIESVVSRVATDLRRQYPAASITVRSEVSRSVEADWRLQTALEQLVENAVEHTSKGAPTAEITLMGDEESLSIRVADDGPGIPEDELVGIVGEQERTQLNHGTGFGLWLVRTVVEDYGGELSYESPPEGGSVIVLTLPTRETAHTELGAASQR